MWLQSLSKLPCEMVTPASQKLTRIHLLLTDGKQLRGNFCSLAIHVKLLSSLLRALEIVEFGAGKKNVEKKIAETLCYAEQYSASSPGARSLGTSGRPRAIVGRGGSRKSCEKINKILARDSTCESAVTLVSGKERFFARAHTFQTCIVATTGFASANSSGFSLFYCSRRVRYVSKGKLWRCEH